MEENKMLTEQALRKWKPVLDHKDMAPVTDSHKRATLATLLENQEKAIKEQMLVETNNVVGGGMSPVVGGESNIKGYNPILIQLVRRAMPNLMAYDICGVQAMSAPTGLIFAMRSRYVGPNGTEAFYNEPQATYSGAAGTNTNGTSSTASGNTGPTGTLAYDTNGVDPFFGYSTSATLNPLS